MKEYLIICRNCGKEVFVNNSNSCFCNDVCRRDSVRKKTNEKNCKKKVKKFKIKCLMCNKVIITNKKNHKYCSQACTKKFNILNRKNKGWYKIRFEILKRDSFTCQYCGKKAPETHLHIDHIEPRKGIPNNLADNSFENLITSCVECNLGKADVLLEKRMLDKDKKTPL